MKNSKQTYIVLPDNVKRMAKISAASEGASLSAYLERLILEDCTKSGVAAFMLRRDENVDQKG